MIPTNKDVIKDWYEFEGASTYEYAHQEVKESKVAASATSSIGSDSYNNEKREDTNDSINDSNNSANIRQVQDDLVKLTQSLEVIKGQLQTLVGERTGSSSK